MNISSLTSTINQLEQSLSQLEGKLAAATKTEAAKRERVNQIERSITKSISPSSLQSKQRDIASLVKDIGTSQSNQSSIRKQIGDKRNQLLKAQESLSKEQERERTKAETNSKRRHREELNRQKEITREIDTQKRLTNSLTTPFSSIETWTVRPIVVQYDVFISHATEDKDELVRPLAERLKEMGFNVWYDEFTLKLGDSLRRSIDRGLANSRYGVVVFSSAFFAKQWSQYELDGLVTREMRGHKVILPIWHRVTKDEVISFSPSLADKLALKSTDLTIEEIAEAIAEQLRAD